MSDDPAQALADTEGVTVGSLRLVLSEALSPIHDRLDRLEREFAEFKRTTEDSLRTIRTTMADMRSGYDVLAADIRALHRRLPPSAEAAE